MQYLLSIRAATCQGRKWACPGRICSWQIILGLHLSFHYFPCTKENFVSWGVSRNFQEFKFGLFSSPLTFPILWVLFFSVRWQQHLFLLFPFPGVGRGFLVDSSRIQPGLHILSAGFCQVWLFWKNPKLAEMFCSGLSVLGGYSMAHCSFSLLRREEKKPLIILAFPVSSFPTLPSWRKSTSVLHHFPKDSHAFLEFSSFLC